MLLCSSIPWLTEWKVLITSKRLILRHGNILAPIRKSDWHHEEPVTSSHIQLCQCQPDRGHLRPHHLSHCLLGWCLRVPAEEWGTSLSHSVAKALDHSVYGLPMRNQLHIINKQWQGSSPRGATENNSELEPLPMSIRLTNNFLLIK